ncbi:MAG: hypothetical protein K9L56_14690 [Clostridiales bacterium]|nr:hypothetical protein [Clostridiales bacterium]
MKEETLQKTLDISKRLAKGENVKLHYIRKIESKDIFLDDIGVTVRVPQFNSYTVTVEEIKIQGDDVRIKTGMANYHDPILQESSKICDTREEADKEAKKLQKKIYLEAIQKLKTELNKWGK